MYSASLPQIVSLRYRLVLLPHSKRAQESADRMDMLLPVFLRDERFDQLRSIHPSFTALAKGFLNSEIN